MASSLFRTTWCRCIGLMLLVIIGLSACGTVSGPGNPSTPGMLTANSATTTAAVTALLKKMTIVGTPTARLVSGNVFEVDGSIKNGDSHQHDIWIKATLFDASGNVIATSAPLNVDDTPAGATVPFAIQGTTPQPTWSSFKVVVVNVTENVNGTGTD